MNTGKDNLNLLHMYVQPWEEKTLNCETPL